MRRFVFATESNREATVGMAAYFFVFGAAYADTPHEICPESHPQTITMYSGSPDIIMDEAMGRSIRFHRLASQWRQQRGAMSSIAEMCTCPAYLSIMAMGKEALPLIFAELRDEGDDPDHWFVALHHITQADPVPDEDKGDMAKMSEAWREWSESDGW